MRYKRPVLFPVSPHSPLPMSSLGKYIFDGVLERFCNIETHRESVGRTRVSFFFLIFITVILRNEKLHSRSSKRKYTPFRDILEDVFRSPHLSI